jgi:type I restriction-modification system DNA methylase subunit
VQLQNNSGALAKLYEPCRYVTFARTGDIYCLFYEQGYNLLKNGGLVCFITSNKWMRAGYGENIRKFFIENTNPDQLIDFAGVKVFESATVDTNILLFTKEKNKEKTTSCIIKNHGIKELSVFVRQNTTTMASKQVSMMLLLSTERKKTNSSPNPSKLFDPFYVAETLKGMGMILLIYG